MPASADGAADGDVWRGALLRELTIVNKRGLHARASAKFVRVVEAHEADVHVSKDGQIVEGASIMGLLMLGAGPGSTIMVSARGTDAAAVLEALAALVDDGFGEDHGED
ncbi:HPr family phosphocarrier protein [Pseudoxanthobacter sp. M-2]|uniref:HPr family phosphocarrier protein n=1 Tax=Pseudoxanthobacter sp. M-2 TaxID=3078754 RepID=UPI0038FCC70A